MTDDIVSPPAPGPGEGLSPDGAMPEGLDPRFWDAQSAKVNFPELTKQFGELQAFKTKADEAAAAVPVEYKLELPGDFKTPEGIEIKYDPTNPIVPKVREWAKAKGLSQADFSEILRFDAEMKVAANEAETKAAVAELEAEQKKLGENGLRRLEAIASFLKTLNLSEDESKALGGIAYSAAATRALEKLVERANGSQIPGDRRDDKPPVPMAKTWAERFMTKTDLTKKAS